MVILLKFFWLEIEVFRILILKLILHTEFINERMFVINFRFHINAICLWSCLFWKMSIFIEFCFMQTWICQGQISVSQFMIKDFKIVVSCVLKKDLHCLQSVLLSLVLCQLTGIISYCSKHMYCSKKLCMICI